MRTLIWKEWREQRLFFFLAVGFIIFYGIVLSIWPQVVGVKKGFPKLIAIIILPLIFSVGIPTTSFTSDFTKKTLDFQLSNPVTSAKIFWMKFLFNLALLFALILLAKLFLRISVDDYARYFLGPHGLSKKTLVIAIFFISILIIYSATCFSSLLLKNTLPAIICTPFILLFGILLVLPLIIVLFLISPYLAIFNFLLFSVLIATFIIFSFITWQKAITKNVSVVRTVFTTAGIIFILSFGSHFIANLLASHKLNKAILHVKTAGIRPTPEKLIPPLVPDKDNAALVYQKAFELMDKLKEKHKTEWECILPSKSETIEKLTPLQRRTISKIMKDPEFVKLYALIEKAVEMPTCRFDIKYEESPLIFFPHRWKMRSLANLIAARTYIFTEEKKYQEAIKSAKTGLRLKHSLNEEPFLVSQEFQRVTDIIAVESIKVLLNKSGNIFSINDYYELIAMTKGTDKFTIRSLEGEIVFFGGPVFDGKISLARLVEFYNTRNEYFEFETYRNIYSSCLGSPILKEDYAFYLQAFSELINYSQKPYLLLLLKTSQLERELFRNRFKATKYKISSMILPSFYKTLNGQARYTANFDSFKLALALKIYQQKHGKYPDSLASLAPEIIPEIPMDQFTGKNYIYRREGKGFMVYSIGENGRDDNGIHDIKQKYDDIAFKVSN